MLAFDYRGFGESEGRPRQSISIKRQIQDFHAAIDAATSIPGVDVRGRGEVHHYPCDHFDVWPGHGWFEKVVADQVSFLGRALATTSTGLEKSAS